MGIKDLLRFMKPHVEPIHIKKYAGKRVGIDAYSWLHKGAYSCSMELCLNMEGDKKFQYLNYFMHRLNLLHHYKITPVVVFDGGNIPCKAGTEQERHRIRKTNRDLAMEKLKEGNISAASELFQRAVSVTPSMAHQLIQILRSENIEFVVAPYEADAQLAYLTSLEAEKGGIVAVISEDSDLLAYSCPAIIFKMDRYGNGEEIVLNKIFESTTRVPYFKHFDKELFTGMCVLAGCDFLPSVPGIGIAKAYSLVSKYRNLDRALSTLKFEKGNQMPEDYSKSFREAVAVFHYAQIYDAEFEILKHIKPIPEKHLQSLEDLDFLGPDIPPAIATAIAKGNLDPITMEAFNHVPTSRIHLNPNSKFRTSDLPPRQEATPMPIQECCFSILSSHKARKEKTTATVQKTTIIEEESKYLHEATTLEKLVSPSNTKSAEENKTISDETPLKVPDNNPFRKRKLAELQLEEVENVTEAVSAVAEVGDSEILCTTLKSQESVDSKPIKAIIDGKAGVKKVKLEGSDRRILNCNKGSILNFFSRTLFPK